MFMEIVILTQLMNAPSYGYQIRQKAAKTVGPYYKINNNQLYPKLRHMEEKGYITKEISVQEGKPNRHIYSITDLGIEYFYTLLKTFPAEDAADENEYLMRIGFFHILDANARADILEKRRKTLHLEYEHMNYLTELYQKEKYVPYSKDYFQFSKDSIMKELDLIDEMLKKAE
ncbi:PadR family transcriptional regulator [Muricomes intestini]|uniref:PadR family transcriptional regulator n=2 Tax=Muricomes intestini TaxID=1796634 RepID=UPI002FE34F12